MTPEYIAAKLTLLPRFKVETLERNPHDETALVVLSGRFTEPVSISDQTANFYLPDLRSIYGLLLAATGEQESRRFEQQWATDIADSELLSSDLHYFASYQHRELYLVLDPEIDWTEVNFTPQRALQSSIIGTDGQRYTKIELYHEGDPIPEGSKVVESGWDHEHCNFCGIKIDSENVGYTSRSSDWAGEWACAWCYRNAVEPHDPRPLLIDYVDRR